jgi:Toprim domain
VNLAQIDRLIGGRTGTFDVVCPLCAPFRRPENQKKKVLRIWRKPDGFASYCCIHCGARGCVFDKTARQIDPKAMARARAEAEALNQKQVAASRRKARALWYHRQTIAGSPAETYLRQVRGYSGTLPATLGFIPAHGDNLPAMIAAFGMAEEIEPGVLQPGDVCGVHLTLLLPDGSGKAGTGRDKIMLGREHTLPIALQPPTDMLALAIAEGIEDALSIHQATGLGAWAAGSASRLPMMAEHVPSYIECVSISVDADRAGQNNAKELAKQLRARGIEVRLLRAGESA